MSVFFVYRSHYQNPGCKHVRRFDADTVLEWFRSIWKPLPKSPDYGWDVADEFAMNLLGRHVYSFARLFEDTAEHGWRPPQSMKELTARLEDALYVTEMKSGPHHIEILTDDDELEMAIYIFDDHYAAKQPERAAFLVREDWRLPDGADDGGFRPKTRTPKVGPKGRSEGATYLAFLAYYDSGSLTDLNDGFECHRVIPGCRLPELVRYLMGVSEGVEWAGEMESLRVAVHAAVADEAARAVGDEAAILTAVAADPRDDVVWSAYSDWLEEHGRPAAGIHLLQRTLARVDAGHYQESRDRTKDELLVQRHIAQACLHTANWGDLDRGDLYHHWILFDDLWAGAHPELANSILRFASRWEVL